MNQVQRILKSKAPVHSIGGQIYKGQNPIYRDVSGPGQLANFVKVQPGVPFVRVK